MLYAYRALEVLWMLLTAKPQEKYA
jgi:hypothetical protein